MKTVWGDTGESVQEEPWACQRDKRLLLQGGEGRHRPGKELLTPCAHSWQGTAYVSSRGGASLSCYLQPQRWVTWLLPLPPSYEQVQVIVHGFQEICAAWHCNQGPTPLGKCTVASGCSNFLSNLCCCRNSLHIPIVWGTPQTSLPLPRLRKQAHPMLSPSPVWAGNRCRRAAYKGRWEYKTKAMWPGVCDWRGTDFSCAAERAKD